MEMPRNMAWEENVRIFQALQNTINTHKKISKKYRRHSKKLRRPQFLTPHIRSFMKNITNKYVLAMFFITGAWIRVIYGMKTTFNFYLMTVLHLMQRDYLGKLGVNYEYQILTCLFSSSSMLFQSTSNLFPSWG